MAEGSVNVPANALEASKLRAANAVQQVPGISKLREGEDVTRFPRAHALYGPDWHGRIGERDTAMLK